MRALHSNPPRLVVIEGNDKGKTFYLRAGSLTLGRSKSDILINDPRISREHVKIEYDPETGKLQFTDLKSLNGCQINGTTLAQGELKDGDKIQIGNTILDCQINIAPGVTEEIRKEPILKTAETPIQTAQDQQLPLQNSTASEVPLSPRPNTIRPRKFQRQLTVAVGGFLVLFLLFTWLTPSGPSNPTKSAGTQSDLDLELAKIRKSLESGELKTALTDALATLQKNPNQFELEELLGDIYSQLKKLEPAIQSYKAAITHQSPSKLVHFKLTRAYIQAGLMTLANEHLNVIDKLIKESPEQKELFVEFANLLLNYPDLNHSFERAMVISKALQTEIAPESSIGYRLEAATLTQLKKLKEAEKIYERALALVPNDQEVLEELAMTKLNLQDLTGAKGITEKWLQQNPNEVKALLAVSYLNFYERNYLATIPKLQQVINLLSKNPENQRRLEALHLLGLVYWEQGQRPEAETYLSESCKLGFQLSCNHQALLTQENKPTPSELPSQPQ
ncbi:FHA domain-containing protein [bacterium]|nr:FHA domain-containing protein [bacterium]NBX83227.1 FHA domain-containing protein [bacterium]